LAKLQSGDSMSQDSSMLEQTGMRAVLSSLCAVIMPIALLSMYLLASRQWIGHFTGIGDLAATSVAVLLGGACMYEVIRHVRWFSGSKARRSIVLASYVLVAPALLFFYALYFVCMVFGDCL
jgi:hypothetical protein